MKTIQLGAGRRLWLLLGLAVLVVLVPLQAGRAAGTNPIVLENQQPGTTSWQFTDYNKAEHHEIEGYASLTSVNKGGSINFMISLSSAAQYTLDVYRMGWYPTGTNPDGTSCAPSCGGRLMQHIGPLAGSTQAACPRVTTSSDPNYGLTECNWTPSYMLTVPTTWTTGVYLVKMTRQDGAKLQNYLTFVVRDDSSTAAVAYSVDVTTWQAYNFWGGSGNANVGISLYGRTNDSTLNDLSGSRAYTVSFDRPYLDSGSVDGAGTFMVWDFPLIRWMESQGYDMTYLTDVDLESNPSVLSNHRVFVNTGHDEYYSDNMRTNIKNAIASGVNMAFFSANNIYYRITWSADAAGQPYRRIHCDKGAQTGLATVEWRNLATPQPENAVLGVMQNGVADDRNFLVYDATSWIYSGTGLVSYTGNGTTGVVTSGAGQNALKGIIGYEFDERAANASSLSSFRSFEPPELQQVGHSLVPASDNGVSAWSDATLYTAPSGATVFSAGTIQWPFAVDNGYNDGFCDCGHTVASAIGQRITNNILGRLTAPAGPAPFVGLTPGSLTFPSQLIGTTSAAQSSVLKNTGTAPLTISSIAAAGTNASDFPVSSDCPLAPASVAAGATCTVSVAFAPSATGARSAKVSISDNASDSPQSVTLSGTGAATAPAVTLAPTTLAFGSQRTGTTSSAQSTTLTNSGTGALTISTIGVGGTNAGDFALTSTCPVTPATLAASSSCTISATFKPTATGARSASIQVTDNASGSPQSVALSGTGTAPAATLSPTSLAFGSQQVGTTSAAQPSTVTNSGTAPLTITSIAVTGANAADFGLTSTCPLAPATLAAAGSCSVSVAFTPAAPGTRAASVQIADDAAGSPQALPLSGTGSAPAVSLSPASLTFGSQLLGTTSAAQSSTLQNTGTAPLAISSIGATGAAAGDYAVTSTCPLAPATLGAGSTCTISATFSPGASGTRSAAVSIADNAADSPQSLGLSGVGATPAPAVSLTPSSLAFGSVLLGSSTTAQSSTVKNTGTSPLTISSISAAGANPADYSVGSDCPLAPATLAAGASCAINVTFAPAAAGPRPANVSIVDDASDSPQSLSLSGTGTTPTPVVSLAPAGGLAFGSQRVGTTSAVLSGSVQNAGSAPLLLSAVSLSGVNAADFFLATDCPQAPAGLAPGQTCSLSVSFTPSGLGSRSAAVQLTDNASDSPQSLPLSGTGTAPSVSLTPASLGFGSQPVGVVSGPLVSTVKNTGAAPLSISSVSLAGANSADFALTSGCPLAPATLAPAGSCTLSLTFKPGAAGPRSASVQLVDDASDSPQSLPLSGTGSTSTVGFDKSLGTKTENVGSTTMTLTTTAAAAAHTRVFAFVEWNNATRTLTSLAGGGLTWTVDTQAKDPSNNHLAIASADAPAGLASGIVLTATFSGSVSHGLIAAASFTSITATAPLDGTASTTGAGVRAWTATVTTANATDLVLAFSTIDANTTSTATAPSSEIHDFGDPNYYAWATTVYQTTSTAGAKTVSGTWAANTGAVSNLTIAAAYKTG